MSWTIVTSRLGHDGAGHLHVVICHHVPQVQEFYLPRLSRETAERYAPVHCPVCLAACGLTVAGRWGSPATLTCACGHTWTPDLPRLSPRALLREVVRLALGPAELTYREARTDPEAAVPAPLRDAVREPVTEAARALNRREWAFDDYETAVAHDLLTKTRRQHRPGTEPSDDDRLRDLQRHLGTLAVYAAMTTGRLGALLSTCSTALRPATAMTVADIEPGPDPFNPPALLDAELALGDLLTVLHAGATGDVDY
ncbi:hypothetical protein [Kitasatospora sp. NPDC001095]